MDKAFMAGVMGLLFSPQGMKHIPKSGDTGVRTKKYCDPKKKKRRKMARDSRRRNQR